MKFTVLNVQQRSLDWFRARLGRLTGSRAADMLAVLKSGKGETAARRRYRMDLVAERLTGRSADEDQFVTKEMQRGIELEAAAFAEYEAVTGQVVTRCGFLSADEIMTGTSLDGYIEDFAGLVELKCPKSVNHLECLRTQEIPEDYLPQMTHHLWVVEDASWCDFVSFDDRFPAGLRLFVKRLNRADVDLAQYEKAALTFLAEVSIEERAVLAQVAA